MNETILVVDDNPANLQIITRFLSESGYRILIAEDGVSALGQLAQSQPDLILLDVAMPEMDGFETCRRIKENRTLSSIPIIFLTARSEISDKLKGFASGAVDYLTKPVQKEEVLARVHTHLTLIQQRRQLETLLAERNRFMQIAAHDLRNPLAVIGGYVELGLADALPADKDNALLTIQQAQIHLAAIIDDFLAVQTARKSNRDETEEFDLCPVVAQVAEHAKMSAEKKGIGLTLELLWKSIGVTGHRGHTHQILSNYVSNAIKYSKSGTTVRILLEPRGDAWRIMVCDQGPGIAPADRVKLFTDFPRISNRPTGGEISTGLGLSIVKNLAEGQGAKVGADFPESGGSVFWLEFPRRVPVRNR